MNTSYETYITSLAWASRKRLYFERHFKKCRACKAKSVHLHHLSYRNLGNEPDKDLIALCGFCHQKIHEYAKLHPEKSLRQNTFDAIALIKAGKIKPKSKKKLKGPITKTWTSGVVKSSSYKNYK